MTECDTAQRRERMRTNLTQKQLDQLAELITFGEGKDGDLFIKDVRGDVYGDVYGNVFGNIEGHVFSGIEGHVLGDIEGSVHGDILGNVQGSIEGDVKVTRKVFRTDPEMEDMLNEVFRKVFGEDW